MSTTVPSRKLFHWQLVLPLLLGFVAYVPILNNGFIADDFVVSQNAEILKTNPLYLYQIPPENFRTTIHLAFGFLKAIAGYQSVVYYGFNIALHLTNVLLLGYFLRIITDEPFVAFIGSSFFAVFSAPQEAVMWLSGMTESLLAFFVLTTLILWAKDRPVLATCMYIGALFSKESGVVVLALVPFLQLYRGKRPFTSTYSLLLPPTVGFGALLLMTLHANPMVSFGLHKVSLHAFLVVTKTLHRLLWPWFYVLLISRWIAIRSWPGFRKLSCSLGVVVLLLTPYMFITYDSALASRNLYLASAALMAVFALLVSDMKASPIARIFVVVFIAFNVGYLWIRKDAQFEERAAPTTQMLQILRTQSPEPVLILGFPYPNVEIARASVATLPGWQHDWIVVGTSGKDCPGCPQLLWDPQVKSYRKVRGY